MNYQKMNTNQLRDIVVQMGADRSKLYGTSKQAIIRTIWDIRHASSETQITDEDRAMQAPIAHIGMGADFITAEGNGKSWRILPDGRITYDMDEFRREMEYYDRNGAFGYWIGEDARPERDVY